ncbi:MAG: right-handed parallel beta-helix repeat-containing protein [Rikenellaceae bacterium]
MKLNFLRITATIVALFNLCIFAEVSAAAKVVTVNSIEEILPYLKQDNVSVKMQPGTYIVTVKDVEAGKYPLKAEVIEGSISNVILLIEGNGSTYDFTDVTIEVETKVFGAFGNNGEFVELHILGNNNVVKNLKLMDVGSKDDFPPYGCVNVIMDGANNLVEGVEVRSTGSMPYGYGEVFGKGAKNTIRHRKHSAVLVRGDYNHLKNCRVIHRSYGHFVFMQAAQNPTIEGCYIEGEMITTDDILKEKGSGSAADKIDFMTVFGYKVPMGYTLSTGEDGIRTYNAGRTMVNGERMKRGSANITVKDCTVKHARGGVALTLSTGFKVVENCTLIGCQGGFATGSGGQIINCRADVAFGAAYSNAYDSDEGVTADITIMPYEGEKFVGNGGKQAAIIWGRNHNITLRRGEGLSEDQEISVYVGGLRRSIGALAEEKDGKASGITINNETNYPIILGNNSSANTITTKGGVIDNGKSNNISKK